MGNRLPTHRPKPNLRPPSYPGVQNYHSNRGGSKVFFPTEDPDSCRQEATQSREESILPRKDISHPRENRRRISLKATAPSLPNASDDWEVSEEPRYGELI
ncbi:hypothetical protein LOD99_1238 [Oopsacas minuta]|uniref:Uncharacterized protein n=1 Tax=Oopsacas minuta TaxID=111878 RepID=A0AAV7K5B4_9METZ|nr:hypothetical protein LOD99_1238 [Oopsacas minuta]